MKTTTIFILLSSLACVPATAAQLYRWVDEKGNVEWRDTPPPPSARKVERRNVGTSTIQTGELPYGVQQAMRNFPVTLWVTNCGEICDKARAHLNRRGVPHTEQNPQSDVEAFKKVSGGSLEVPLLLVGNNRLKGYLESDWDAALDSAGYPKTALTPVKPPAKAPATPVAATEPPAVRLYTNSECGAQCAEARQLLSGRGVRFQEIVVETLPAIEDLKKLSGDTFVPTLAAGRFVVRGFDPADYNRILDQAGFRVSRETSPQ